MSKNRGFKELIGATIAKVNTKAINEVILIDSQGNKYYIEAITGPLGIPVIEMRKDPSTECKHENVEYEPGPAMAIDFCMDCGKTWVF